MTLFELVGMLRGPEASVSMAGIQLDNGGTCALTVRPVSNISTTERSFAVDVTWRTF